MLVQVITDHNIEGSDEFTRRVKAEVSHVLSRFDDRVTRVEVHLSDERGTHSETSHKRCIIEARPSGHQPVVVTNKGATLEDAYIGAAKKVQRLLESILGRLSDRKGRTSIRTDRYHAS